MSATSSVFCHRLVYSIAIACTCFLSSATAVDILNETFDDDPVGGLPDSATSILGADNFAPGTADGSDVEIAGAGGTYSDPFGGADNRSLVEDNFGGGTTNPNLWPFVTWGLGATYSAGTIDFDLYMQDDPSKLWTYVDFRLGNTAGGIPSTAGDTVVYDNFRVQGGTGFYFFNNAVGPSNGHPFTADTAHHISMVINADKTYTVSVDGNPVERDGSADIPWHSPALDGFNILSIGGAWGPASVNALTAGPFYIDNLVITAIPEPATWLLSGLLLIAAWAGRRRC